MKVEVLLSCMFKEPGTLLPCLNLDSDVVIVNQCDEDSCQKLTDGKGHGVKFVSSTQRGLSRSRNMAIDNSSADICLLSDDDEVYAPGYAATLQRTYLDWPDADVILFQVAGGRGKVYSPRPFRVGYLRALKFASWQISFRRSSVISKGIRFDEQMGSGTGHGSGEEIKFLYDCLRHGLRLQYVPVEIAALVDNGESVWFKGFTDSYFYNRGWSTARYMGKVFALLYCLYFAVMKYKLYRNDNTFLSALWNMIKGIFVNSRDIKVG